MLYSLHHCMVLIVIVEGHTIQYNKKIKNERHNIALKIVWYEL